jgi:hypothetical protein
MAATPQSLSEPELAIVRETERDRMDGLDEDELLDLHARVRRARTKYVKLYRRQASARVEDIGGRGLARAKNARDRAKAEIFEDALARVSRRLSVVAKQSAAELKAERLAAARSEAAAPSTAPSPRRTTTKATARQPARRTAKSPATKKRHATTLAAGAQRQARKDSRD